MDPSHFSPFGTKHQKEKKEERDQHSLIVVLLDAFPINIITTSCSTSVATILDAFQVVSS
jgi:adenosine/AMP kinase